MNDKAADETVSHLTHPANAAGQVLSHDQAAFETLIHSANSPKNGNQAAGYKLGLFVALIAGLTLSFPVAAKLYKWVDNDGITHYGETIPPEYAGKDRVELNKEGRVINTEEVMTPERRHAKELEDKKKREDENAALEQKRRDKTLLNTYSNVHEIDLARTRSLQQVNARINMLQSYLKSANENILSLQNEAEGYTKANKEIPESLQDDLKNAQERTDQLQKDMEKPNTDKAALEARYKADRERYIELTGKK